MKIIAIGDPHIKSDNIIEFDLFETRLINLIQKENPDFIVVLGDLMHYHEKIYTQPLNRAYTFLQRISKNNDVFVLVGNHDMINNQQFLTDNHWMNGIKHWKEKITVVDKTIVIKKNKHTFFLVPYVFPGKFIEALETNNLDDWKNSSLIFSHQEFKGCKMGAIVSEHGDTWDEKWPLVVSGHIHQNQKIGEKIYYPGSAMQHAFGESDKNIIAILESEQPGIWKIREEDLDLPRKRIITTELDKIDKVKIKKDEQIKLTIKGNQEEFKQFKKTQKYKELVEKGIKVVFKPKELKRDKTKGDDNVENSGHFDKILRDLIICEKNLQLYNLYEKIVNNNIRDEIIIL